MRAKVKIRVVVIIVAAVVLTALPGCWYYSFTDIPYPDIETVEVANITNSTTQYDTADRLTQDLVAELDGSGLFKIVDSDGDGRLSGELVSFAREVNSYTPDEVPEEYRFKIVARMTFKNLRKDKVIWETSIDGTGVYPASDTDEDARIEAVKNLIQRIIQRLQEG